MRDHRLFARVVCFVDAKGLSLVQARLLGCCVRDGAATITTDVNSPQLTHIICTSDAYGSHVATLNTRFVAIVRPEWVFRSFLLQTLLPVDRFSADPTLFFSTLAIAPGRVEKDPRKVLDGLIHHFGGHVVDDKDGQSSARAGATHFLSADEDERMDGSDHDTVFGPMPTESDVASAVDAWSQAQVDQSATVDFAIPRQVVDLLGNAAGIADRFAVGYSWLEECVRSKSRAAEGPGSSGARSNGNDRHGRRGESVAIERLDLIAYANAYAGARSIHADTLNARKASAEKGVALQDVAAGVIVLLAQHVPPEVKDKASEILKSVQAKVATVPLGESYKDIIRKVVANASLVVCQYQDGFEYEEAQRQEKRVISLYSVFCGRVCDGDKSHPEAIIHRPIKSYGGIDGMRKLVITLSGFTSRTRPSREDIQVAIHATGACVLPVLSRAHSTHLLCFEAKGEKYKKAKSWGFRNILPHKWLFDCLSEWKYLSEEGYLWDTPSTVDVPEAKQQAQPVVKTTNAAAPAEPEPDVECMPEKKPNTIPEKAPAALDASMLTGARSNRFEIDDVLSELDGRTPLRSKRSAGGLDGGPNGLSCVLFDTPTVKSKTTRSSPNGKAQQQKALFDDRESDDEVQLPAKRTPTKAATKKKAENSVDRDETLPLEAKEAAASPAKTEKENPVETPVEISVKPASKSSKKTEKKSTVETPPAKKGRKRLSTRDGNEAAISAAPTPKEPPASSTKRQKVATVDLTTTAKLPTRKFLLTGSQEECVINESIILSLKGEVSHTGRKFDPTCTHIICSELKRTEKFVAGCAAGKWILKPSYLEMSAVSGSFVDERDHEWGPRDAKRMDPRIWPSAPSFWREKRSSGHAGAFAGWCFLVHPKSVPPAEMCERIILSSGGEVIALDRKLDLKALVSECSKKLVALATEGLPATKDPWLKKFRKHEITCINASFLIDYITKDQSSRPNVDDYLL
ncbi:TPA: hypothetical protein N0F65_005919 [Lagenidium giganteum]|uniref:BRCT domain-containing protein n=1 Tax=Lagenidium giganteum TaxID=4803 RepID=A0AAV2ZC07_9STRA|nr:TPA: hypothetical protein N0F65_005919 [Lagenidium giganteum]